MSEGDGSSGRTAYTYTNADVVRFAIALAASMSRRVTHVGLIEDLLHEFKA